MKRDNYSGFSFFFNPHELTKIVLQKFYKLLLHQIALCGLANWTKKVFPVFPRERPYTARPNGPPFQFFSALQDFFPERFSPQRVPPSFFLLFCDRMDVGKCQRVPPFSFFSALWDFFPKIKVFPASIFGCFATKHLQLWQKWWQFRKCPPSALDPGAPLGPSFEYVVFSKFFFS